MSNSTSRLSSRMSCRTLNKSLLLCGQPKKKSVLDDALYFQKKLEACHEQNKCLEQKMRQLEAQLENTTQALLKMHENNLSEKDKIERELKRIRAIEKNRRLNQEFLAELKVMLAAEGNWRRALKGLDDHGQ